MPSAAIARARTAPRHASTRASTPSGTAVVTSTVPPPPTNTDPATPRSLDSRDQSGSPGFRARDGPENTPVSESP